MRALIFIFHILHLSYPLLLTMATERGEQFQYGLGASAEVIDDGYALRVRAGNSPMGRGAHTQA